MSILLNTYIKGALRLREETEKGSADHEAASALYTRLKENVGNTIFGDSSENRTDRMKILNELNHLTERLFDCSFLDYCESSSNQQASQSQIPKDYKKNVEYKLSPDDIQVKFYTNIIPTAYCHQLSKQDFPLVQVTVDNSQPTSSDISLSITTFIEDYSYQAQESITVAKGTREYRALLPVFKHNALTTLNDMRKVTLHYSVKQLAPEARTLKEGTKDLYLMARNQALIAIRAENKEIQDLTRYLAAWVTPNRSEIATMQREAIRYRPQAFIGYQEDTAESVREQALAIFSALKFKDLTYVNSVLNWEIQPGHITQKVRLPGECIAEGLYVNCLDGTVLFASLLERCGIAPVLVLVPGHAFVGWYATEPVDDQVEPVDDQYEFLETTMIATGNFEQAQNNARQCYEQALANGDFKRELFHKDGFARLIDIRQQRQAGIYPLE